MPKKQSIKTLILKSQYVTEDYEDTKNRMSGFREAFYKEFPEEYKKMIESQNSSSDRQEDNELEGEHEIDESEPKSETMRKLYRRITKITHPDKVESEFLTSYFKKSSTAYGENDVGTLFTIAATLNIDVSDIDSDDIAKELEASIQSKEAHAWNMRNSLAWSWAEAETEEEKQIIRDQLAEHVKNKY